MPGTTGLSLVQREVVNVDVLLSMLLDAWREERAQAARWLHRLFVASDTEDRGQISFADFSYVLTCVAPTRTRGDAIRMYQEALDRHPAALVEGEPGTAHISIHAASSTSAAPLSPLRPPPLGAA